MREPRSTWARIAWVLVFGFIAWYFLLGGRVSLYQNAGLATPTAYISPSLPFPTFVATPSQRLLPTAPIPSPTSSPTPQATLSAFCHQIPTNVLDEITFDVLCVPPDAPLARTYVVAVPNWSRGPIDDSILYTATADYSGAGRPSAVGSLDLEVQVVPNSARAQRNADLTDRRYAFLSTVTLPGGLPAQLGAESNLSKVVISFSRGSVVFQISAHVASGVSPTTAARTAMSDYALRFARDYLAALNP